MATKKSPPKKRRLPEGLDTSISETTSTELEAEYPRIRRMKVRNFRCIGRTGVEVYLDNIVILIGANNSGKSAVLTAYDIALRSGEKAVDLAIDDFPHRKIPEEADIESYPEIILETVVTPKTTPGAQWIIQDDDGCEPFVRERWRWKKPGPPEHVGWNKDKEGQNKWADESSDEEKVPWGANSVSKPKRPEPLRLNPFDSPTKSAENIIKLIKDSIKSGMNNSDLGDLKEVYRKVIKSASDELKHVLAVMSDTISQVFPNYIVKLDLPHDSMLDNSIADAIAKVDPKMYLGIPEHLSLLEHQGSGAQRMLMWAALKSRAEQKQLSKKPSQGLSYLLLLDEPELCLHPNAVREACRVLYDLAKLPNWQAMITTHSPVFIDLNNDHTSVVRVEKDVDSNCFGGTTIYRPVKAELATSDKENLKLLTAYDPYVAEFFFAKQIIVVEGDTEYVALRKIIQIEQRLKRPDKQCNYDDIHIIRARGKSCIPSICKILKQFNKPYAVLHDSDRPQKSDGTANGRWTDNCTIEKHTGDGTIRVAMIPNFEEVFLKRCISSDETKPYEAFKAVDRNLKLRNDLIMLLDTLLGIKEVPPVGCIRWNRFFDLENAYNEYCNAPKIVPKQGMLPCIK